MNRSSDSLTGSPSFTLSTKRLEDGRYVASCDSLPSLPSQTAVHEAEAIRAMSRIVEEHIMTGGFRNR